VRGVLLRLALLQLMLSLALGALWFVVAPTPEYEVASGGLFFVSSQPSEFIAMDGWFAGLAAVAGIVAGLYVARGDRWSIPALVLVAAGGLGGSWLAWKLGHALGPGEAQLEAGLVGGTIVYGPLDLEALGVLAVWPIVSLVVVLFALAWRSPEPEADTGPEPDVSAEEPVERSETA
jgi:hypothetical protein